MNHLKPYPAYKDPGVSWLGEIPEHWKLLPGRACYRAKKVHNTGLKERTVLSLSYGQIVIKPEDKLHGLVPASFETYQIVEPKDIVIRPTDLQNDWVSLRFGLSGHRGIITSAYLCFNTQPVMRSEYGHLLLHTYDLKKVFYGLGSGLRQNLDWQDFKYLPCFVPPLPEQTVIVRYLDYMDRRIRRYINAKKKLIALLNEQKQAIIHRAVTRGLSLDTATKLLNSLPEYGVNSAWRVARLCNISHLRSEKNKPELELLSVFLGRGVIQYGRGGGQVHKPSLDLSNYQVVHVGDLVLNNQQAWRGSVGVSAYNGIISPAYIVLSLAPSIQPRFADYIFKSKVVVDQFVTSSKGVGDIQRDVYFPWLRNVKVPLPPLEEQERIVKYLDDELMELEKQVFGYDHEMNLLREYRTRLIADVVTGKLDVREAAASLPEEAEEEPIEEVELLNENGEAMDNGEETLAGVSDDE